MTPDELRQKVEFDVLELIKAGLVNGSVSEERAQTLSQHVLDSIKPGMSFEELYKAIAKLDDSCNELAPIVLPFMREYEEHITKQSIDGVRDLIKQGQYNAATKLAEKVINQDVQLVWQGTARPTPTPQTP